MFWRRNNDLGKKILNSEEYDKLCRRNSEIVSRLEELSSKLKAIESDVAHLRGRFNQRLAKIGEAEVKPQQSENINTDNTVYFG